MEPFDTIASLRPGMPESRYSIVDRPKPTTISTAYDTEGRWPQRKQYASSAGSVTVDHCGIIESVGFGSGFPQSVRVAGLHIGMAWRDAQALYPELRLGADMCGIQSYQGAVTTDGFELRLNIKDGQILSFGLARLGTAQYLADYAAFIEMKGDEAQAVRDAKNAREGRWRTITDPEAMLREWAEHCRPWDELSTRYVAYAEWLFKATPEQRHDAARNWNWDYGVPPLLYIVRQPDCDLATALEIFYLAQPSWYHQFDVDPSCKRLLDGDVYSLVKEIRARVNAGGFSRREIAFDGIGMFDREIGANTEFTPRNVFRVKLPGKAVQDGDFDDGVPIEALQAVPNFGQR